MLHLRLRGHPGAQQGNGLDFHQGVRIGERADLHQRASRPGVAEVAAAHRVDELPVGHVPHIHPDPHDVAEGGTGGLKNGAYVVEHLLGLPDHVAGAHEFTIGVDRQHPGDVEESARLDRVGVVADRLRQLPGQPNPPHGTSPGESMIRITSGLG